MIYEIVEHALFALEIKVRGLVHAQRAALGWKRNKILTRNGHKTRRKLISFFNSHIFTLQKLFFEIIVTTV